MIQRTIVPQPATAVLTRTAKTSRPHLEPLIDCISQSSCLYARPHCAIAAEPTCETAMEPKDGTVRCSELELTEFSQIKEEPLVRSIHMMHTMINKLPPYILSKCSDLRYLFLTNNLIEEIGPRFLSGCIKLETLSLAGNRIRRLPADLTSSVCNETRALGSADFIEVDLSRNHIDALHTNFLGACKLQIVNLRNNELKQLPAGFLKGSAETLLRLDLQHNLLEALPGRALQGFTGLVELYLNNNVLIGLPVFSRSVTSLLFCICNRTD